VIGAALAGIAFTLPASKFFQYTIAFFWLMAFSSATHDIAADGFYMLGLSKHDQAFFVGIRNTFYRFAMLAGQGRWSYLPGEMEKMAGDNNQWAWSITFLFLPPCSWPFSSGTCLFFPIPVSDVKRESKSVKQVVADFVETFVTFFKKEGIVLSIVFILIFRLGEAQLVKLATPFLLDEPEVGGLGLSTSNIGFVYGTAGMIALTLGGILGGIVVSRGGLKYWMLPMVIAMNLPNLMFVLLAFVQPESLWIITGSVVIEQFGYGLDLRLLCFI
jgi:MFS transporter, PAT family, beta-lactamase induction signal transducer AmpG